MPWLRPASIHVLSIVHITLVLLPRLAPRLLLLRALVLSIHLLASHLLHVLLKHGILFGPHRCHHLVHVRILGSLIGHLARRQRGLQDLATRARDGPLLGVGAAIISIWLLLLQNGCKLRLATGCIHARRNRCDRTLRLILYLHDLVLKLLVLTLLHVVLFLHREELGTLLLRQIGLLDLLCRWPVDHWQLIVTVDSVGLVNIGQLLLAGEGRLAEGLARGAAGARYLGRRQHCHVGLVHAVHLLARTVLMLPSVNVLLFHNVYFYQFIIQINN